MKKLFAILSAISFMLYALVDFTKNVLETYFYVLLKNGVGNFSTPDYFINAGMCKTVLSAVGIVCLAAFVVTLFAKGKK